MHITIPIRSVQLQTQGDGEKNETQQAGYRHIGTSLTEDHTQDGDATESACGESDQEVIGIITCAEPLFKVYLIVDFMKFELFFSSSVIGKPPYPRPEFLQQPNEKRISNLIVFGESFGVILSETSRQSDLAVVEEQDLAGDAIVFAIGLPCDEPGAREVVEEWIEVVVIREDPVRLLMDHKAERCVQPVYFP